MKMNEKYLIQSEKVPKTIYYEPNFITCEEEQMLMNCVNSAPAHKWTQLSNRRLQTWGGLPQPKGMIQEPIPQWLQLYCERIGSLSLFDNNVPNHVLINEYLPGQGIMPHEDGPLFFPTVTTINLGSHTFLDFYHKITDDCNQDQNLVVREPVFSLLLEPRSLLVLQHDAYKSFLHGIQEVKQDVISNKIANVSSCKNIEMGKSLQRTTRISLTIRYVPNTIKLNPKLIPFLRNK